MVGAGWRIAYIANNIAVLNVDNNNREIVDIILPILIVIIAGELVDALLQRNRNRGFNSLPFVLPGNALKQMRGKLGQIKRFCGQGFGHGQFTRLTIDDFLAEQFL